MEKDETRKIGRRAVLGAALGGAAAAAAAALAAPSTVLGATGDAMHVGEDHTATTTTSIETTGAHALSAKTNAGDAIRGWSDSANGSGVFGYNTDPAGFGVYGKNGGRGVAALGTYDAALWASTSGWSAPLALKVEGKVSFSRSGRATILKGKSSVDVDLRAKGGLSGTPLCFANLTSYRSGTYVIAARPNYPSTGKLRIYLNKVVTSSVYVAWMVLS